MTTNKPLRPHSFAVLEGGTMPVRSTSQSAGADLFTRERVLIEHGRIYPVPLGVKLCPSVNPDWVALLFIRSGLAKKGLRLANGVGVIDPDYEGEITALIETRGDAVALEKGDKVAQIVFTKIMIPTCPVRDIERGAGGFGSTGRT